MGDIVNLRRARKRKERERKESEARQNRALFGASKAERRLAQDERALIENQLDGALIASPDAD